MNSLQNLDRLCAQYGSEMCDQVGGCLKTKEGNPDRAKTENLITKALGVLQEDGVYAFFLYLAAQAKSGRNEKSESGGQKPKPDSLAAKALAEKAGDLLADRQTVSLAIPPNASRIQGILEAIRMENGLADHIGELSLAKRLLEQALIYARYHAKALGDPS